MQGQARRFAFKPLGLPQPDMLTGGSGQHAARCASSFVLGCKGWHYAPCLAVQAAIEHGPPRLAIRGSSTLPLISSRAQPPSAHRTPSPPYRILWQAAPPGKGVVAGPAPTLQAVGGTREATLGALATKISGGVEKVLQKRLCSACRLLLLLPLVVAAAKSHSKPAHQLACDWRSPQPGKPAHQPVLPAPRTVRG